MHLQITLRHVWSGLLTSLRNSSTARRRGMRLGFSLLTSLRNSSTARRFRNASGVRLTHLTAQLEHGSQVSERMRLGSVLLTSLRSSSTAHRFWNAMCAAPRPSFHCQSKVSAHLLHAATRGLEHASGVRVRLTHLTLSPGYRNYRNYRGH